MEKTFFCDLMNGDWFKIGDLLLIKGRGKGQALRIIPSPDVVMNLRDDLEVERVGAVNIEVLP